MAAGSPAPDGAARGIGAIVIVLGHCALVKSLTTKAADDLVISLMQPLGVAGVSCFFTLSGFVLTWVTPRGTGARPHLAQPLCAHLPAARDHLGTRRRAALDDGRAPRRL